jgi:hypothetical protein
MLLVSIKVACVKKDRNPHVLPMIIAMWRIWRNVEFQTHRTAPSSHSILPQPSINRQTINLSQVITSQNITRHSSQPSKLHPRQRLCSTSLGKSTWGAPNTPACSTQIIFLVGVIQLGPKPSVAHLRTHSYRTLWPELGLNVENKLWLLSNATRLLCFIHCVECVHHNVLQDQPPDGRRHDTRCTLFKITS